MFDSEFYPTPEHVIEEMLLGYSVADKVVLEPSAGKGDIVDHLTLQGASVIACEKHDELRKIVATKCKVLTDDFFTLTSDQVSHIDFIVMNPPFSNAEKHILHAWDIAPAGCKIIALCNLRTIENYSFRDRKILSRIVDQNGGYKNLGECFNQSERKTNVEVALIQIQKPGNNYNVEFDGFFTEEDEAEEQVNGIMSYNVVRDLVNRYVAAIKLYDQQLELGVQMNALTKGFYSSELSFSCSEDGKPKHRIDFKKDLQKSGWKFIFDKMNMQKYATKGLKEDINKFVEQQQHIPFTMRNIYQMIDIVIGTQKQRMDKALLEVFDKLTQHYDENRYNVEGWKTNSHYLINEKFIMPGMCYQDQRWYKGESKIQLGYGGNFDLIEDFIKALCYISGDNYEKHGCIRDWIQYPYKTITSTKVYYHSSYDDHYDSHLTKKKELYEKGIKCEMVHSEPVYGEWFEWAYFRVKAYKKGTMHFEFKDLELWGKFNQHIARIKGYPLFEPGRRKSPKMAA